MPRRLPWQVHREPTHVSPPARHVASPKLPQKRTRLSEIGSDSGKEAAPSSSKKSKPLGNGLRVGTPPNSSPPEHLPESFMREGMENDDKYRMVEDEFLTTAQRFTVHLHAAEYKRLEKMARARNAETISSISRPVTQKMPDHTKRKVEGLARSKTQQSTIQTLLGNKTEAMQDSEESSDGEGLAYFNTILRGLMDSPRREAASLSKLPCGAATRAAAGFQKPAAHSTQSQGQVTESPKHNSTIRLSIAPKSHMDSSTESSDLDDDLDAPVPVTRHASLNKRLIPTGSSRSTSLALTTQPKSSSTHKQSSPHPPSDEHQNPSTHSHVAPQSGQAPSTEAASRVRRRLWQTRLEDNKAKENKDKTDLDVIPTFL